jgi:DNA (cytosine-5)-methyltransferase 1
MKLFSMFSGYGGAEFALTKAKIPYEVAGYSEIDKYSIQCYEQNHGKVKNYGDCTKINVGELPDFDLLTGGFPCQAFSAAGKGGGELDPRGTLVWDIIRIAEAKQPKYMLLENVKGFTFKKFKQTFDKVLSDLDRIGYKVYWKVLNSKDFGIPQNRERVWFVCFRKDLPQSEFNDFQFPTPKPLNLLLKDVLEDEVDEKYYLKPERVANLLQDVKMPNTSYCIDANYHKGTNVQQYLDKKRRQIVPILTPDRINKRQNGRRFKEDGEPSFTLTGQDRHGIMQINNPRHSQQRVYDTNGVSPTISSGNLGGGKEPSKILQINNPKHSNERVYSADGLSPALNTMQGGDRQPFIQQNVSIRKLTPTECFRLMGFLNDEINLDGLSNTQRYKLAGNGWEINVVSKLFKQMFQGDVDE